jgi:carbon starvation protein
MVFILLALGLGVTLHRFKVQLAFASVPFVCALFAAIYLGQQLPLMPEWLPATGGSTTTTWALILLVYCFIASIAPVWILLQPRDYLSSFLLYACLASGLIGILISPLAGGPDLALRYPAFLGFHTEKLGYLFPALFITIACGACSGFHSIVASGTTAKQLDREIDARTVGYGSMLLEGVLALISVSTVAILATGSPETKLAPPALFSSGLGRFLAQLGLPREVGSSFGLLALSTFLLTTLDTGTRLGRYVLEELLELKGKLAILLSTAATLGLPLLFSLMTFRDASGEAIPIWKVIWPVFGSTNQLLGGLALMVITVWLRRNSRPYWITLAPMIFMVAATTVSLGQLAWRHGLSLIGGISTTLLALALVLLVEAARAILASPPPTSGSSG